VLFIIKRFKRCFPVCGSAIKVGQEICNYIGVDPNKMDSILYEPGLAYYYKSEAALKIVVHS
jgi:predicted DCC family thiol-disulfide oxidoreductase YuxK